MNISVIYNVFTEASSGNASDFLADEDSVQTAKDIKDNLQTLGHNVNLFEIREDNGHELSQVSCDIFFNQAFGIGNIPKSESEVTKLLETYNLRFTGSGTDAINLSNDKVSSKYFFLHHKIPTANFVVINDVQNIPNLNLEFPVILKLVNEHSSIGLDETSIVADMESLRMKAKQLFLQYKRNILIEEFIDGKEINATVLGNGDSAEVLPVSEVTFGKYFDNHPKIIDFKAKWNAGDPAYDESVSVCPAEIDKETEDKIKQLAKSVHVLSGCKDYSRVDFRLDKNNNPYVLEVNANPGIGAADGAIKSAKAVGYSYPKFLEKIVTCAFERYV